VKGFILNVYPQHRNTGEHKLMTIKWTKSTVSDTYRTEKFGNMMCDTIQGEVDQSSDGTWCGWFTNHSDRSKTEFRLDFKSKGAATRWVNAKLRQRGVK
jgi:hypothetical protein